MDSAGTARYAPAVLARMHQLRRKEWRRPACWARWAPMRRRDRNRLLLRSHWWCCPDWCPKRLWHVAAVHGAAVLVRGWVPVSVFAGWKHSQSLRIRPLDPNSPMSAMSIRQTRTPEEPADEEWQPVTRVRHVVCACWMLVPRAGKRQAAYRSKPIARSVVGEQERVDSRQLPRARCERPAQPMARPNSRSRRWEVGPAAINPSLPPRAPLRANLQNIGLRCQPGKAQAACAL